MDLQVMFQSLKGLILTYLPRKNKSSELSFNPSKVWF